MAQQAASGVPERAKQGAEARRREAWWWTEASIWTERMVSALGNGVKGGKWYSLMDKVARPTTLATAWPKVARNHGAAGVDGQSIEGPKLARPNFRRSNRARQVCKDSPLEEIGFELVVPCRSASRQGPTNCPAIIIAVDDRNYLQT